MAQHGGKRKPDGRPPVSPGVGKTAKRHDLETPKTPGLVDSDLQQGDVQQLEAAQQAVPAQKKSTGQKRKGSTKQGRTDRPRQTEAAPDPIQFAGERIGGNPFDPSGGGGPVLDVEAWMPLIRRVAEAPLSGGATGAALVRLLSALRQRPQQQSYTLIDRQELDEILLGG